MKKYKLGAIIFIRSDSKRLPQKTFLPLGKRKLFHWTIQAAYKLNVNEVIVATSRESSDDNLVNELKELGYKVFRGSKEDIAARAIDCCMEYKLDFFIRINGDSPFINVPIINQAISLIRKEVDYISNLKPRSFPYGVSCEILKFVKFRDVYQNFSQEEKIHITTYYNKNLNQINFVSCLPLDEDYSSLRLTIDTPEDYAVLQYYLSYSKLSDFNNLDIKLLIEDFKEIVHDKFIFHKA